jgi:hypothetical protein
MGTVDGGTDWAIDFKLTNESVYGGGLGFWISPCVNASSYKGISFWARGQTPAGGCPAEAGAGGCFSFSLGTAATTAVSDAGAGTCTGTGTACAAPQVSGLPLSMTWTQFQIPWSSFTGGMANGAASNPTGDGLLGLTFAVNLAFVPVDAGPDGAAIYGPMPANLDLQIDDIQFMP